jgi:hypothetical protein
MNIIQNDTLLRKIRTIPEYTSENDTSLCRGDFDGRFYALEPMRSDGIHRRSFDDFQISESGEIETKVLEGVSCLVNEQNV